jgi:hypothetical protein
MSYGVAKSLIVLAALLAAVGVFCWRLYLRLWVAFRH